jgi:flavin reductase (DIM6/NTAB) family NADH-FMN oxidoreductase RutF
VDHKKLRECLGLFGTGVIIACARKKNFLTENFFAEKIIDNKIFDKTFLKETAIGRLSDRFSDALSEKMSHSVLGNNLLTRLKKIFADEFFGMTINSFSSVSLDPSLVMFCIDNKSSNLQLFKKNRYFSLNVLSQEQNALATAFARPKNSTKWGVEPYFFSKKGNPIFQNSLGFFECKKHRVIKVGDHHVVIGEVIDFAKINDKSPLLYYLGKYAALQK